MKKQVAPSGWWNDFFVYCSRKAVGGDRDAISVIKAYLNFWGFPLPELVGTFNELPKVPQRLISAVAFGRIKPDELSIVLSSARFVSPSG
ncbi:hypothetical protein ACFL5J_01485 [Thermodesulfobacteriota bacterium]